MAGFNPFSSLLAGGLQRLQTSPFAGLLGMGQNAAPIVQQPEMAPAVQTAQMQPALDKGKMQTPDLRTGIQQSALALGIDPLDLATAISYETGGTFDPVKGGPTTQYGRHRGLIQFGEPQAREYGVDWSNPVGSQTGPDGAIVKYLRKAGVKPGMGLLDIYSAINAGSVGRYGASDANNGGAPGNVQDKVNSMSEHRAKAAKFLGGSYAPAMSQQGSPLDRVLAAARGDGPQIPFTGLTRPTGGASGQSQGQTKQPQSTLERVLAATKGSPTNLQLGASSGQQQGAGGEGAVDLGAEEVAGLSQQLNQRRMTPSQKGDQRRQALKQRMSQRKKA